MRARSRFVRSAPVRSAPVRLPLIRSILFLPLLALAACASGSVTFSDTTRSDLGSEWVRSDKDTSRPLTRNDLRWPGDNGFAQSAQVIVLPRGVLLDRFGDEEGGFLSPKGARFSGRALPDACAATDYHVYRVRRPLPVLAGTAAPWFGQGGGAIQFRADAQVKTLVADGVLERLPPVAAKPC